MTPDSDAERAEKAWIDALWRGVADGLKPVQAPIAKQCFLAGRQSVLDDHPAILRAAADLAAENALRDPTIATASYLLWLADRLEAEK